MLIAETRISQLFDRVQSLGHAHQGVTQRETERRRVVDHLELAADGVGHALRHDRDGGGDGVSRLERAHHHVERFGKLCGQLLHAAAAHEHQRLERQSKAESEAKGEAAEYIVEVQFRPRYGKRRGQHHEDEHAIRARLDAARLDDVVETAHRSLGEGRSRSQGATPSASFGRRTSAATRTVSSRRSPAR